MSRAITILFLFALTAVLGLHASSATAQIVVAGALSGSVTDEQDAVVANVIVVVINDQTSFRRQTTTSNQGTFAFPSLPPGAYTVTARREGFTPVDINHVDLNVNDRTVLNIRLRVGTLTDAVTVTADSLALEHATDVSQLVDERRVRELPLNGKSFQRLVQLAPGIGGGTNNLSASGGRAYTNNYTLDGTSLNDERTPNGVAVSGGAAADLNPGPSLISTEAIQEYRILTTNADASFGHGSGAQVNVVTKAGSSEFHGSAYEFLRDDALDASDYFNEGPYFDESGKPVPPPFHQNLYGGTLGGPIGRSGHFFFGNFEGYRQNLQQTASATAPNAALLNLVPGDLGQLLRTFYIDRGIVPASGNPAGAFSPIGALQRAAAVAAGFPAALFDGNPSNGEAGTVLMSTAAPRDITQQSAGIRTDHRLSDRLSLAARFGYARPLQRTATAFPADVGLTDQKWYSAWVQAQDQLSSSQLFEARAGWQRTINLSNREGGFDPRFAAIGLVAPFGLNIAPTGTGLGTIAISGDQGFVDKQRIPQASVQHTWSRGALTLRSGADLRQVVVDVANTSAARPTWTFNGFVGANGLLGASPAQPQGVAAAASFGAAFGAVAGPPTPMRQWSSDQQEYFVQADWRARNVTVNAGFRYSYFGVYRERDNAMSNLFALNPAGEIVADVSPFAFGRTANVSAALTDDRPLYQPDRNNLQPRIGAAWDVGGRDRTVVRAAYGLYFDRIYQVEFSGNVTNGPFAVSSSATDVPFLLGVPAPVNPSTAAANFTAVDPTLHDPSMHRFNAVVEQRINSATSVSVAYVGARGIELVRALDPNAGAAVPVAQRPDPRFGRQRFITNDGRSTYNALQIVARRRFVKGVDFTMAYTAGRSVDDTSTDLIFGTLPNLLNQGANPDLDGVQGGGSQFAPRGLALDRGVSDFNVTHSLAMSHLVELPVGAGRRYLSDASGFVNGLVSGWSIAGVAVLRSGSPFSVVLGRDADDDGDAASDRPMLRSGSIDDLYTHSGGTQYLLASEDALKRLGVVQPVTDIARALPRNAFRGPAFSQYDLSIIKQIPLGGRQRLSVECNIFNVFNHANFDVPDSDLSSPFFGLISNTVSTTTPRQIQIGGRFHF